MKFFSAFAAPAFLLASLLAGHANATAQNGPGFGAAPDLANTCKAGYYWSASQKKCVKIPAGSH